MPVSEIHRTKKRMSRSRSRSECREVTITPTDTVIGIDAKTKAKKRIDLSTLNPNVPIVKALIGRHTIGQTIPIHANRSWSLVLTKVEPS